MRKEMEEEMERALAEPICSAMKRRARLSPPPGSIYDMLKNTFKTAQDKPLVITYRQKEHAAGFYALGDIYMTD